LDEGRLFGCGKLKEGKKITEGTRIAKEKRISEGELLKGNC
jgi:hypothetical protein